MTSHFKYFAFISYSTQDLEWGRRVQRKLEGYRMPATLCSKHGWERRPIKPVFFAPTDIQPNDLNDELQQRLSDSRYLIVICSPHSAQSEWVGKEIEFFHNLGRTKKILFFIVDGIPNSGNSLTECFNPVVARLGIPEILGANIHEHIYRLPWLNRERAFVQLVSRMLGVEFDSIWRRHRRRLCAKALEWTLGVIAVILLAIGIRAASRPFDAEVQLTEFPACNSELPQLRNASVTLVLDNETKADTIATIRSSAFFHNIPRHFLNRHVNIIVNAQDFLTLDTVVTLEKKLSLPIQRDSHAYGDICFRLWDELQERTYPGAEVDVEGYKAVADSEGYIRLSIPLEKQRIRYRVSCQNPPAEGTIGTLDGSYAVVEVR